MSPRLSIQHNRFLSFELSFRPCMVVLAVSSTFSLALLTQVFLVGFSSWLVSSPSQPSVGTEVLSTSEDGEGNYIEVPSCGDFFSLLSVGTKYPVGFTLGVGSVICINPFSWVWLQDGSGLELQDTQSDETFGIS